MPAALGEGEATAICGVVEASDAAVLRCLRRDVIQVEAWHVPGFHIEGRAVEHCQALVVALEEALGEPPPEVLVLGVLVKDGVLLAVLHEHRAAVTVEDQGALGHLAARPDRAPAVLVDGHGESGVLAPQHVVVHRLMDALPLATLVALQLRGYAVGVLRNGPGRAEDVACGEALLGCELLAHTVALPEEIGDLSIGADQLAGLAREGVDAGIGSGQPSKWVGLEGHIVHI
mmetsp:Transcript_70529/g.228604  ORF Transcript_70529/g.228604 Transcript_70529/m.228604 type:complete len:231 (-) Transcript_70529:724-1416(-)